MREAEKEVTKFKRKHEEIMSVRGYRETTSQGCKVRRTTHRREYGLPQFNRDVSVKDGHRIPEFYERHKDCLPHIQSNLDASNRRGSGDGGSRSNE